MRRIRPLFIDEDIDIAEIYDKRLVLDRDYTVIKYENNINAGTEAKITIAGRGNYTDTATGTFTINKADVTVTAPTANTLTYNAAEQALVTAGTGNGGTMRYSLAENGTYTTDIPTAKNAGTYTVWYKVQGDTNHNDSTPAHVEVTIAKANLTNRHVVLFGYKYADGNESMSATLLKFNGAQGSDVLLPNKDYTISAQYDDAAVGSEKTGTYTITILNENYTINGQEVLTETFGHGKILEPPEPLPQQNLGADYRLVFMPKECIEVTPDLQGKYADPDAVATALLQQASAHKIDDKTPATTDNRLFELHLLKKTTDGSYVRVYDLPAGGITVTLPYPTGTNRNDYAYAVAHMLTAGTNAGSVEFPAVALTDAGIQVRLTSLSPVALTWVKADKPAPAQTTTTQPTPAPDDSQYYTCPDCGYHNWTAVDGGYKCDHCGHFEAKDLSAYPNVKGAYHPAGDASAAAKATKTAKAVPATADDMPVGALLALLCLSAAALVGLIFYRKKHK